MWLELETQSYIHSHRIIIIKNNKCRIYSDSSKTHIKQVIILWGPGSDREEA